MLFCSTTIPSNENCPVKPALPHLGSSARGGVCLIAVSTSPNVSYPPYAHALAGAGAGLAAVALLHPLDTIRTHMQSSYIAPSSSSEAGQHTLYRTLRYIIVHQGATSLYRGLFPASVGSVLSWAFYFHFFQRARNIISPYFRHPTAAHLLAGTVAGVITSVATNPIWVVKVRLQLQSERGRSLRPGARPYSGLSDGLVTIIREEGVLGLYRGLSPSLWLVSHGALQFTLYEMVKSYLQRRKESSLDSLVSFRNNANLGNEKAASVSDALIASTSSKLVASVTTYPLQVARTRMQERMADGVRYGSFHRALWHIAITEGVPGLYRGLTANILRVTPQAAVTFVTYEQILRMCANK